MTEHKAGRELDALIAERVMGWKRWKFSSPDRSGNEAFTYTTLVPPEYDGSNLQHLSMIIPRYSTSIADAWEVVSKFTSGKKQVEIVNHDPTFYRFGDYWEVSIDGYFAIAETAPLAICLTALRAVGYRQESEAR